MEAAGVPAPSAHYAIGLELGAARVTPNPKQPIYIALGRCRCYPRRCGGYQPRDGLTSSVTTSHRNSWSTEVAGRRRFRFGANWRRYAAHLSEGQIRAAQDALVAMLGPLDGLTFLDVG